MTLTAEINGKTRKSVISGIELVLSEVKSGFFYGGAEANHGSVSWRLDGDPAEKTATQFYDEGK